MDNDIIDLKRQLVAVSKKALELGLVVNTVGNFSVRVPQAERIFITPTHYPYDDLTTEDIVEVDKMGRVVDGRHQPSSETPVHCAVYRARADVFAIIHTEPIYVNAFGALGWSVEPVVVSLLASVGGSVPVLPFQPSGSEEFAQHMLEVIGNGHAIIWANHGLLAVGRSLSEAFERTIFIERCAKVQHLALQLGHPRVLSKEQLGKVEV